MITPDEARALTITNETVSKELDSISLKITEAAANGTVRVISPISSSARMFLEKCGYTVVKNHGTDPIDFTISWS